MLALGFRAVNHAPDMTQAAAAYSLSTEAEPGVPEGFRRLLVTGPFFQLMGPVYLKAREDGGAVIALRVEQKHLNVQGIGHGGMLATVADGALGINVSLARGRHAAQVTVSLTMDYLSGAREGDWLEAHAKVTRLGSRLAYASCDLMVGDRQVLRSSAVFALRDKPLPGATAAGTLQDG
jgi:uncharacterized protein (TIGR00369 family)